MRSWILPPDLALHEPVSRSLRIEGYSTSVRLERIFWDVLEQIAVREGMSTGALVGEIYRDVYMVSAEFRNFASLLRVICVHHLEQRRHGPGDAAAGTPAAGRSPGSSTGNLSPHRTVSDLP